MNNKEQSELLGFDKLNALDVLNNKLHGNFQLTGSISLIEFGVLKRKVGDIDIVVESFKQVRKKFQHKRYNLTDNTSHSDDSGKKSKSKKLERVSFVIGEVKVCAFKGKKQEFKVCKYMIDRKFKVSHPRYSIAAKEKYVRIAAKLTTPLTEAQRKRYKKHKSDIVAYCVKASRLEIDLYP